ncbi:unnamed protein product [Didymodactylos carnosus]|uniref:Uncharacterized protein n=1 Tax=Didymodactylos carnosus TaxID=1234261 RepID=A0A8S2ZKH5_9BILA|nr:unnamed protein product [Didymodactylos carnosus]
MVECSRLYVSKIWDKLPYLQSDIDNIIKFINETPKPPNQLFQISSMDVIRTIMIVIGFILFLIFVLLLLLCVYKRRCTSEIADRQLQTNVQVSLSAQNNELEDLMRLYYSKINEKTRGN